MSQNVEEDMAIDIPNPSPQVDEIPIEQLELELPPVYDGQIQLSELLSRMVQGIYTELAEMAETLPSASDAARKRTLADWVVKTKKQVVKLYAVAKWSRDAEVVQKCMNITSFLMNQNFQFDAATQALISGKQNLDQARLRNHDLLTSLDVLTTGSYLRLPKCIKKNVTPQSPLTDEEVAKTLKDMEGVILYRLRMSEIIPVEMSRYRIADGRVFFTVPKLFEVSLCLQGPAADAGWFFVHVEFPVTPKGDIASLQDFPREPTGITKRYITDEADFRMAYYLVPDPENPDVSKLPSGVVDTPLVRLYNFLQMMSLSYQLEILWFQAERMRSLGWRESMSVQMSSDRKTMTVKYWTRPNPPSHHPGQTRTKQKSPPLIGGTLTISIESINMRTARTPEEIVLARIQRQVKLGSTKPSDEVEPLRLFAKWTPSEGVLALNVPLMELTLPPNDLEIDCENLDFEIMLRKVIEKHAQVLLVAITNKFQNDPSLEFSEPGVVIAEKDAIHINLCTDEVVTININSRTGRLNLRDINSFAIAGRAPRFYYTARAVNDQPDRMVEFLSVLRTKTILDLAEEKARYLGYQSYKTRNFRPLDYGRLGERKGLLYIQLKRFPDNYLVLVVKAKGFSYVLMTTRGVPEDPLAPMAIDDIAFLNFERIKASRNSSEASSASNPQPLGAFNDLRSDVGVSAGFDLTIQTIKELYSYCCARVAYMNVERQFKERGIEYTQVSPTSGTNGTTLPPELARIQSSLARSVPALCVQATDILSGAPAAEAAMPNIRVIPLNWWSEESAQVVTCVKLKYVQQPLGKRAGSKIIRPSKRIIYDTTEAIVSFLSENVNVCVDEFLEEWAKVSKMVVIAREVAKMSKEKGWKDMQLLSFDLQTVEFAYAEGYSVSITCEDQLSTSGAKFDLRFTRTAPPSEADSDGASSSSSPADTFNPHDDAEPFLSNILRHGHGRLAPSLERLVMVLRDTLPIVVELEKIRRVCIDEPYHVDTYAKASGWYRILYPTLKHAVDFRLMTGQRVAIMDASHSLFKPSNVRTDSASKKGKSKDNSVSSLPAASTSVSSASLSASTSTSSNASSSSSPNSLIDKTLLQPIPDFATITKAVVAEGGASRNLIDLNQGLICDTNTVGTIMQNVHRRVVEKLKGMKKS